MNAADRDTCRAAAGRLGDADAVIARVLDIAGARQLALDAMLRLSAVAWSDDIATACVECADAPRLLLNPAFVEKHCAAPRALAFLLLHELAHVSLGHTGLHTRVTAAQNVAFDAFINASLLHGLVERGRSAEGWDALVVGYYPADASPSFLLRPPPGWPTAPRWSASAGLPDALRRLHRRLYEPRPFSLDPLSGPRAPRWQSVTYGEIVSALLREDSSADVLSGRLLGGHGETDTERAATTGGRDTRAAELLTEVLAKLPRDAAERQGVGGDPFALRLHGHRDDALIGALRVLIRRTLTPDIGDPGRSLQPVPLWTADASRDRRAHVRRHAARVLGAPAPLLFLGDAMRNRPRAAGSVAIYLDVSGSMGDWVHRLHAALVPLRRLLAPKCFAFSTIIEELTRADFVRGRVRSTGGTDITPVLAHLTSQARAGRVRRALLLTDGLVGSPKRATLRAFTATGVALHVGLVGTCALRSFNWAASVTRLAAANGD